VTQKVSGGEIRYLKCIFQQNGYNKDHIRRDLHPKQKPKLKDAKPTRIARLQYHKSYSSKISRLLAKFNVRTVHIPRKKTIHMLRSVKDDLGLIVPGVNVYGNVMQVAVLKCVRKCKKLPVGEKYIYPLYTKMTLDSTEK
jgi:hypothetical protein